MKLPEALKRPAVRIPLLMALIAAASVWAASSCEEQRRMMRLAGDRHISFVRLLARTVEELGRRPEKIGELLEAPEGGGLAPLYRVFAREFAALPEFKDLAPPGAGPLERLGPIHVWCSTAGEQDRREITWSGYFFRLHPRPGSEKDYVIFSWPAEGGEALPTLAWVSTRPGKLYYTSASRYAGPGAGPAPADLGEAPFEGKVNLFSPGKAGSSGRDFPEEVKKTGGRLWAVKELPARKRPPAGAGGRR